MKQGKEKEGEEHTWNAEDVVHPSLGDGRSTSWRQRGRREDRRRGRGALQRWRGLARTEREETKRRHDEIGRGAISFLLGPREKRKERDVFPRAGQPETPEKTTMPSARVRANMRREGLVLPTLAICQVYLPTCWMMDFVVLPKIKICQVHLPTCWRCWLISTPRKWPHACKYPSFLCWQWYGA